MITALPMQRHTDHHSGETIDKVTKAVHGVDEYIRSFHMHMYALVNSIGGIVALSLIWPLGGIFISVMGVVAYITVVLIDKKLIVILRERNLKEHDVSKLFFDYLSNIKTIITLRFQSRVLDTIKKYIAKVWPPYRKHNVVNELKWFVMDIVLQLSVLGSILYFCYHQLQISDTIMI